MEQLDFITCERKIIRVYYGLLNTPDRKIIVSGKYNSNIQLSL